MEIKLSHKCLVSHLWDARFRLKWPNKSCRRRYEKIKIFVGPCISTKFCARCSVMIFINLSESLAACHDGKIENGVLVEFEKPAKLLSSSLLVSMQILLLNPVTDNASSHNRYPNNFKLESELVSVKLSDCLASIIQIVAISKITFCHFYQESGRCSVHVIHIFKIVTNCYFLLQESNTFSWLVGFPSLPFSSMKSERSLNNPLEL